MNAIGNSMKMKTTLISICFGMLSAVSLGAHSQIILEETFESGNMSTTTNADGFKWQSNNNTSVVTEAPPCGGLSAGTPTAIYNNKVICNGPQTPAGGGNWIAKNGENSLRFRYPAGQPWTEQRFFLGKGYPEIWVSYWIRVPTNYVRGPEATYNGSGNNKWGVWIMGRMPEEYATDYVSRVEMQDWPNAVNPDNADLKMSFTNGSDMTYHPSAIYHNFITPADSGRWMKIIYHLKSSATQSSTDGILRMYRQWEGDTGATLICDINSLNVGVGQGSIDAGFDGWAGGYLMGYTNAPYANDTEWLVDDFIVSDTPPDDIFAVAPKPPSLAAVR